MSQYVPTVESNVCRLRTGYERVLAHRSSEPFINSAKQDGVVEAIDSKLKVIKIKYKDGSKVTFAYGELFTNNGGGGFHVSQQTVLNDFKIGDKVSKGDIVCYNKEFFSPDPYSKQVDWKLGCSANVVLIEGDSTIEDSSTISQRLSEKLVFNPTHTREVVLTEDTTIHKIVGIGNEITSVDPLLTFDNSGIPDTLASGIDEETIALLNKLNRSTPKAKYNGVVVKIEALYNGSLDDMSPSMRAVVERVTKDTNKRSKFSKDSSNTDDFQPSVPLTGTDRIGIIDLTPGTVILKFFIKQNMGVNSGDKLVFATSLKSVVSRVMNNPIEVEDGSLQIDGKISALGISNRIVGSPLLIGISSRILEKMEMDILDMYFN